MLPIVGGGHARLQPVYVRDVADGMINSLRSRDAIGKDYYLAGPEVLTCARSLPVTHPKPLNPNLQVRCACATRSARITTWPGRRFPCARLLADAHAQKARLREVLSAQAECLQCALHQSHRGVLSALVASAGASAFPVGACRLAPSTRTG